MVGKREHDVYRLVTLEDIWEDIGKGLQEKKISTPGQGLYIISYRNKFRCKCVCACV